MNKNLCLNNSEKEWILKVRSTLSSILEDEVQEDTFPIPPDNEIWYMAYNGSNIIEPNPTASFGIDVHIISNTIENGKGVIKFSGPVTTIGENAFNQTELGEITIPRTVSSFGKGAFSMCAVSRVNIPMECNITELPPNLFKYSILSRVSIPDSVTTIGKEAFRECTSLQSVKMSKKVKKIDDRAFYNCTEMKPIDLPMTLTYIGVDAFLYCKLNSVSISESMVLGNYAFRYTVINNLYIGNISPSIIANNRLSGATVRSIYINMTSVPATFRNLTSTDGTSITFGNDVVNIEDNAFKSCMNITSLTFGKKLTTIGTNAFYECSRLTSIILPNSVTTVGVQAFLGCSAVTSIILSDNITTIGSLAFSECRNLTSINIPDSVTNIEIYAFAECTGLTSINIPESVTSIGDGVFAGCTGLTSITVDSNNSVYDSRDNCNAIIETTTNTLIAGCSTTIIPESVISIGTYAFYGCTGLTSINIPENVTGIGDNAFAGCTNITSITCNPAEPPTLGNNAFQGITNFSIYVPSESVDIYKAAGGWSTYASRIQAISA